MRKKVSILTALVVVFACLSIGALITYRQAGGQLIWIDKAAEPGSVFWVSSVAGTNYASCGRGPATPCATVDYAIGLCTDDKGDVVYVMPGHVEEGDTSTAFFTADTAGMSIIGLGSGSDRPRFDYNYTTSYAMVTAANVTLKNLVFRPGASSTVVGITVAAGGDFLTIDNCEFAIGEASGTDEFIDAVVVGSGANDVKIVNNVFRTAITDAGCQEAINLGVGGAVARTRIENNLFYGNYQTAAVIDGSTAVTEINVTNNRIKVKDGEPGIELAAATTGILADNEIESTGISNPDVAIVAAACSWFQDYVVSTDGSAPQLIGTSVETTQPVGTVFYTVTTVAAGASVATGGLAITGASSGVLELVDATIAVGSTALASANGTAAAELYSNNAKGSGVFLHAVQSSLTAGSNVSILAYTFTMVGAISGTTTITTTITKSLYGRQVILETGKVVSIKSDTQTFNAGGTFNVYLVWRRLTAGATITAR